jgi:hypothetical protein
VKSSTTTGTDAEIAVDPVWYGGKLVARPVARTNAHPKKTSPNKATDSFAKEDFMETSTDVDRCQGMIILLS